MAKYDYLVVGSSLFGSVFAREATDAGKKELAAQETNVIFGGRLAEYKYYDMDAAIAAALASCKKL